MGQNPCWCFWSLHSFYYKPLDRNLSSSESRLHCVPLSLPHLLRFKFQAKALSGLCYLCLLFGRIVRGNYLCRCVSLNCPPVHLTDVLRPLTADFGLLWWIPPVRETKLKQVSIIRVPSAEVCCSWWIIWGEEDEGKQWWWSSSVSPE